MLFKPLHVYRKTFREQDNRSTGGGIIWIGDVNIPLIGVKMNEGQSDAAHSVDAMFVAIKELVCGQLALDGSVNTYESTVGNSIAALTGTLKAPLWWPECQAVAVRQLCVDSCRDYTDGDRTSQCIISAPNDRLSEENQSGQLQRRTTRLCMPLLLILPRS